MTQNASKDAIIDSNTFESNKDGFQNYAADFSSALKNVQYTNAKESKTQSSNKGQFADKTNAGSSVESMPASFYSSKNESLPYVKEESRRTKNAVDIDADFHDSASRSTLKRPDNQSQKFKNSNKKVKKSRTEKNKQTVENENSEKYELLFEKLLPGLPDVRELNMELFLKILENTKNSFNEPKKDLAYFENSVDYLKMVVEQYKYITENRVPVEKVSSLTFCLQTPLPPKEIALGFIEKTSQECCVLFRFYHRPTFSKNLDDLYRLSPAEYTSELKTFLPLCYSVMAVGALFSKSDNNTAPESSKKTRNKRSGRTASKIMNDKDLADEGYKYFLAARRLIDLTNARDLYSIQTIVMLFIFLQCSARISTCYLFIGVAMRSALREGLHRNIPFGTPGFSILDIEMRKRTFFSIYKMDVYVNTMLGLPRTISQQDFDQSLPLEVEDDCLTHDGIVSPPKSEFSNDDNRNKDMEQPFAESTLSSACIANQHTKLIMILDEIVEGLYPIKKANNLISHDFVTKLECKLNDWLAELPEELHPGISDFSKFSASASKRHFFHKANRLLRLSFLQVQILLYRPFIHYLTFKNSKNRYHLKPDELSIKRADNCLEVAQTVITLAKEMMDNHLLSGNYWFSVYTIFFSVAGLIFYIHEFVPTNEMEIAKYKKCVQLSKIGKDILDVLKNSSMAASRTYNILNILFESLNKKTKTFMLQQQLLEEQQLKQQVQKQGPYFSPGQQSPDNSNTMLASPFFLDKQDSNTPNIGQPRAETIANNQNSNTMANSLLATTPENQNVENVSNKNPLSSKISIEQSLEELYNMDFSNFEQFMGDASSKENNMINNAFAKIAPIANSLQNPNTATDGKIFADNVNSYLSNSGNSSSDSNTSGNLPANVLNFPTSTDLHPYLPQSPLHFSSVGNQSAPNFASDETAITGASMSNSSSMFKNSSSFPLFPKTNIAATSKQSKQTILNQSNRNTDESVNSLSNTEYPLRNEDTSQTQVPANNAKTPSVPDVNPTSITNINVNDQLRNEDFTPQPKDNSNNNKGNDNAHMSASNSNNGAEDPLYLTGIFDQLDMQLFGRFLPPYMSRANDTNSVQSAAPADSASEKKP
ncbi:hypothetical protein ACO0QE_001154 [Hanseniaspora vineae]